VAIQDFIPAGGAVSGIVPGISVFSSFSPRLLRFGYASFEP
jgi:hypothetical protein